MLSTTRIFLAIALFTVIASGCSPAAQDPSAPSDEQPIEQPGDASTGSRLAFGLYDLEDGTVQAIGTLEWVDLEGGFWAIKGGTEAEGDAGKIVAVIGDVGSLDAELKALEGKTVQVKGTRLEGVSVRMAGPEIAVSSVEEISDTPGPAE